MPGDYATIQGAIDAVTTLDGDIIDPSGTLSGGSHSGKDAGILKRKREVKSVPTASSGSTILTNSVAAREIFADNKKAIGQAYNVGFGGKTTLNELYDILRNLLTPYNEKIAKLQPVYGPDRPGDIKESLASIDKARQLLGYNPEYDIKSGLEKAIDWYVNYFRTLEIK